MCGFAGFISYGQSSLMDAAYLKNIAKTMSAKIITRGPDDSGEWANTITNDGKALSVGIGFRRLAIVDLTKTGHQPMYSESGRYILVFNGEIYNHQELKSMLPISSNWNGRSDTEILLACIEKWGVEAALKRTVGMFAIAIWDNKERSLILIRDRFGEKPLYYGWVINQSGDSSNFIFGSELKALRAFPGFSNRVSNDALSLYMHYTYVPTPFSIHESIFKLEPGCMLSICSKKLDKTTRLVLPLNTEKIHGAISLKRWWSLAKVVEKSAINPIFSDTEALEKLEKRLIDSVSLQTRTDVPLGAFLSGGIDSTTVVSLMQSQSMHAIKTFTIGFEETGFNEAPYAKAIAYHLGTDHSELYVTAKNAQSVIHLLPQIYDEPFADSSQIPTFLVSKLAREKVTVALSGDAGDELFGGYSRYFWGPRIWNKLEWLPFPVRRRLGSAIMSIPSKTWDVLGFPLNAILDNSRGIAGLGTKLHKLSDRLKTVSNFDELYENLVSEWQNPSVVVKGSSLDIVNIKSFSNLYLLDKSWPNVGVEQHQLRMMFRDSMSYLPDDILCKVDRAAMAVSLETRVPFLDHRVAELAWQMPLHMKIRNGQGKWILRQVLKKFVPDELIDRPKVGFGVPIGEWLRGPMREWAEELLNEGRLEQEGYFHPSPIRIKWAEHLSGRYDHTASLWTVLMFQAWLELNN